MILLLRASIFVIVQNFHDTVQDFLKKVNFFLLSLQIVEKNEKEKLLKIGSQLSFKDVN